MGATDVLDNVVSNEEDVKGVVGKVSSGAGRRGLRLRDRRAGRGRRRRRGDRASGRGAGRASQYPIAVVADAENAEAASEFVDRVLGADGQRSSRGRRVRAAMRRAFDVSLAVGGRACARVPSPPILALFLRISPGELFAQLGSDVALDALWVSLKTGLIAHFFVLLVGTPAAYFLATRAFPRPRRRDHARRAPARPAPGRRRHRACSPLSARRGLLGETLDAARRSRSRSPRPRSCSRSPSSQRPSTCGWRSRPSRRSTRHLARRFPNAGREPARGRSGASPCRWPPAGSAPARRSPGHAASVSSARRSCSPAASRAVTQTLPLAIYAQLDLDPDIAIAIGALLVARQPHRAPRRQAPAVMDALHVDLAHPSARAFSVELALERRARRSRSSARPARARRRVLRAIAGLARARARRDRDRAARSGSTPSAALDCRPSSARSASSSRTTPSSRT